MEYGVTERSNSGPSSHANRSANRFVHLRLRIVAFIPRNAWTHQWPLECAHSSRQGSTFCYASAFLDHAQPDHVAMCTRDQEGFRLTSLNHFQPCRLTIGMPILFSPPCSISLNRSLPPGRKREAFKCNNRMGVKPRRNLFQVTGKEKKKNGRENYTTTTWQQPKTKTRKTILCSDACRSSVKILQESTTNCSKEKQKKNKKKRGRGVE